jgi:hypothetical protein
VGKAGYARCRTPEQKDEMDPRHDMTGLDGDREVDFSDGEPLVVDPTAERTSTDEADRGDWLREERPPHWD